MESSPTTRPSVTRQTSRVPGGFETDEELSPIKTEFDHSEIDDHTEIDGPSYATLPSLPAIDDDSLLLAPSESGRSRTTGDVSTLDEKEIRRRLMDVESSFLPELSPAVPSGRSGADDTFVYGEQHPSGLSEYAGTDQADDEKSMEMATIRDPKGVNKVSESPATPPEMYKTPAPRRGASPDYGSAPEEATTSSSEPMSSSPTAAAAARTISRVVSMSSMEGYETADDKLHVDSSFDKGDGENTTDQDPTPRKNSIPSTSSSRLESPTLAKATVQEGEDSADGDVDDLQYNSVRSRKRPKFFSSRMASQRSSYTSNATTSTEGASDITLGADYALQSGGAVPFGGSLNSRPSTQLSRSTSLGSLASGISGLSDGDDKINLISGGLEGNLGTLDEEDDFSVKGVRRPQAQNDPSAPATPKRTHALISTPTDTVIAQHVRDIQVPATIAREYRNQYRPGSPDKRVGMPTPSIGRNGKNLTLKEQSSTIDRLGKENWDLKIKIHYLDAALNQRSDEGVKAMTSENVELKTAKIKYQREIRELKRNIRELERRLKDTEQQLADRAMKAPPAKNVETHNPESVQELELEINYLRERGESYELEVERLRNDGVAKEGEKRRLAEVVKAMRESRSGEGDPGVREEMDMWKDLLESETARREQADEENRKLREEMSRLRSNPSSTETYNSLSKGHQMSSTYPLSPGLDRSVEREGAFSAASSTLVEQLTHENAELRREVGAQTSMLTSRNREKERLYQEIEDLKLALRRADGTRSIAGDSIFERSASRAHGRSASRASDVTRLTQMSDAERESYEIKNGELRDQVSELKLHLQDMSRKYHMCLSELEGADVIRIDYENLRRDYNEDIKAANEDIQQMQAERNEELRIREEVEADLRDLKANAEEKFEQLEDELAQKDEDLQRLQNEMRNRKEESNALRSEVRSMSEGLMRVEEDALTKIKRIQELELENEELNGELESQEKTLYEVNRKLEKVTIQQESSQSEIAFLREEQDGDKIKNSDLESALKTVQASLDSERERMKDLEARLADERHQREVIGSKEKQEVQKIMNDLNREASGARDEARLLKQTLQTRELEVSTWKQRLEELEHSIREALGDPNGTRSSFITSIGKLQRDLDRTSSELNIARTNLSEKERLLQDREDLLESHGLESRKLADLLERERLARRADQAQYDQWQKTHVYTSRTVTQNETRIRELETLRSGDRKKLAALEQQYKDHIGERNNLLLALWNRISTICGADWQHQNALVNGHLPSPDVVTNMLPIFSKNLLLAVKTVEGILSSLKGKVRCIERDLWKDYQTLEQNLDLRVKRLDRLESIVQNDHLSGSHNPVSDIAKLQGENRLLKAELSALQKQDSRGHTSRTDQRHPSDATASSSSRASLSASLMRHHSSSAVEALVMNAENQAVPMSSAPIEPSQQRWIHRLKELERRLKAEREARLLDRTGARKRLEEGRMENRELRMELERERVRKGRG